MSQENPWAKLRKRLVCDIGVIADCEKRLWDGVEDLGVHHLDFDYCKRQLQFIRERVDMMTARMDDFDRQYVQPALDAAEGGVH